MDVIGDDVGVIGDYKESLYGFYKAFIDGYIGR